MKPTYEEVKQMTLPEALLHGVEVRVCATRHDWLQPISHANIYYGYAIDRYSLDLAPLEYTQLTEYLYLNTGKKFLGVRVYWWGDPK